MTLTPFYYAYKCLDSIYRKGAYSGIELNRYLNNASVNDRPLISKLVYGVLDRDIELEYIIGLFTQKVKPAIMPVLKIGVYALFYLDIPDYAVVSETVKLTKDIGKSALSGYVNAVLRNIEKCGKEGVKYPEDREEYLSVTYSFPRWAVRRLIEQLGEDEAEGFMSSESQAPFTHIRVNIGKITPKDFETKYLKDKVTYKKSLLEDAFWVKGQELRKIDASLFTAQSLGSMLTVRAFEAQEGSEVLDLCAAPGGKSIYTKQLYGCKRVVACDVYRHRVDLIRSYSSRMGVDVEAAVNDATAVKEQWKDSFDVVLCDVPCSGFGVFYDKPDIKLNRTENTISELTQIQKSILNNAALYVKQGGRLVYSTCTVFREENTDIIGEFLSSHEDFVLKKTPIPKELGIAPYVLDDKAVSFLPHRDGVEGFFIAVMERTSKRVSND